MPNLHSAGPDTLAEMNAQHFDLLPACIVSTTWPTAPGSGLTLAAFSTQGYVRSGSLLSYVDQPARAVTLPSSAGTYYLALTKDTHSTPGSFTRVPGSHYAYLQSATAPTYPDGTTPIASAVVSGGNITSVDTAPALTPPLSRQTADAVAITDGRISLGGHSPTGVLDVQGSVVASDAANNYYGLRLWPVAPSGATVVNAIRVQALTGAASGTTALNGLSMLEQPASSAEINTIYSALSSGGNRYHLNLGGTAQSVFGGNVGIGIKPPGNARLYIEGDKATYNVLVFHPLGADASAGQPVLFLNVAGAQVGSISTNATATAFNTSSDRRLKRNISPLTDALTTLRQLRPVSFTWNVDDSSGIGFLAHEAQQVIPEAVTGEPDQVDANGQILPQGMDHSKLVPWLVGALQEVTQRLEALEEALGV